jgi:glycosyltransferase involved in cell wall biosynthesis
LKVAAIIPTLAHHTEDYLKVAVESLRATTDWDIIVVTNGSKDKPSLGHIKGITNHIHTRDQGQCNAVNIGVQLAPPDTDYYFISNDDMYYAPSWMNDMLEEEEWPFVWSPNLIEPVNNYGSAAPFLKLDAGFTLDEFKPELVKDFVKVHEDNEIEDGFNFPVFIDKNLWNFLGGYDVAYDPWGSNSDTDLQTRINLAGVIPLRLRDVLVYHFSNKSGTFDGTHQDFYQNNIDYFRDKFGFDRDELGSDVWYNKDMIPEDKERVKYDQKPYRSN